jgi:diadenosine tetraphosphate (Ap4A) HIT family hydrolase
LAGRPGTPFEEVLPNVERSQQILAQRSLIAVVADVAPIGRGHCLVVPNRHELSVMQLTSLERRQLADSAYAASRAISAAFGGPVLMFEHGQCHHRSGDQDPCGIDHAHLHVVESDEFAWQRITTAFKFKPHPGVNALCAVENEHSGYLFVEVPNVRAAVSFHPNPPSQVLRRLVARRDSTSGILWNWKDMVLLSEVASLGTQIMETIALFRDSSAFQAHLSDPFKLDPAIEPTPRLEEIS